MRLYGYHYDFLVDYDCISVAGILDILNYLMVKNNIKKVKHKTSG